MYFLRRTLNALLTGAFITVFCLSGCGSGRIEDTTVIVNKDGSVDSVIVDVFDKYYYDEDGLKAKAQAEVDAYNDKHGDGAVKIQELKTGEDGSVMAKVSFSSGEDYSAFNEVHFFSGTVREAEDAGYVFTTALKSVDGENETISSHEIISDKADSHIVITDELVNLRMYSKIMYVSPGVTVLSPKEAKVEEGMEGLAYVICK